MSKRVISSVSLNPTNGKNEFKKISSAQKLRAILEDAHNSNLIVDFWTRDKAFKHKAFFSVPEDRKRHFALTPQEGFPLESFQKLVEQEANTEKPLQIFVNLFFKGQAVVCFVGRIVKMTGSTIELEIPSQYYALQRRKDHRYQIPNGYELYVDLVDPSGNSKQRVKKRMFDLSVGGLSFFIQANEMRYYQPNVILRFVKFSLQGRQVVTHAEIRQSRAMKCPDGSDGALIGIQFKKMAPDEKQFLLQYLSERIVQYASHFMFAND